MVVAPGAITFVALIAVWMWASANLAGGGLILPSPGAVVGALVADWSIIVRALGFTLGTASIGLLVGVLVAVVLVAISVAIVPLRRPMMRQVTILFCLPLATIAPLLFLLLPLPGPQIVVAASSVVFPVYLALEQGLTAKHQAWEDLTQVLGGTKMHHFWSVQVPAATKEFLVAMRIAGPAAILGTTLAEYFGGANGIGVLMINALSQLNAPRAYALGVVITLTCAAAYLVVGLVSRAFPWTSELHDVD
ncbi:ABC transporter permease [Leifsonia sp. NCR5]|uniref:ABC transporter permease n=1 Tax=Leifsonia sp. NCR5 TaxID=1978342 RepID=UPI000A19A0C8|nr:ABC transporter permease subunit [Leifsonia sp. NCR5]